MIAIILQKSSKNPIHYQNTGDKTLRREMTSGYDYYYSCMIYDRYYCVRKVRVLTIIGRKDTFA